MDEVLADRLLALPHRNILAGEVPRPEARLEILAQHHCDAAIIVAGVVVGDDADALDNGLVVDEDRDDDGMSIDRGAAREGAVFKLHRTSDVVLLVVIGEGDLAQPRGLGRTFLPVAEALELDRDRAAIGAAGDDRGGAVGDSGHGLAELYIPDGKGRLGPQILRRGAGVLRCGPRVLCQSRTGKSGEAGQQHQRQHYPRPFSALAQHQLTLRYEQDLSADSK